MMKRLLILVTFFGLMAHLSDVQGSAKKSQEELNKQLFIAVDFRNVVNLEKIRGLLNAGANVNAVTNRGWTALMFAAFCGKPEVVELLLQAGANVNAADNDGKTALMWAAEFGHADVIKLLLRAGADVNAVTNRGWTALLGAASRRNRAEIFRLLLQAGADVNAVRHHNGYTALMFAVTRCDTEVVKLLLQAGADVNSVNNRGVIGMAANREIRQLFKLYKALKVISIAKQFDHEPKPEDYIQENIVPAGTSEQEVWSMLEQDGEQLDQRIKAFEQDHIDYWRNRVQEAYKLFFNDDPVPLRTLFTQEIYARFELLPEIVSFFNSRGDFIYVLKQLQQGATEQERERLQKMIDIEDTERRQQLDREALEIALD